MSLHGNTIVCIPLKNYNLEIFYGTKFIDPTHSINIHITSTLKFS